MDWSTRKSSRVGTRPTENGKQWALRRKLAKKHERARNGVLALLLMVVNPRSLEHHSSGIVSIHARAETADGAAGDRFRLRITSVMLL